MRRIVVFVSACLVILQWGLSPACAQDAGSEKTLIIYYSRTGNTKIVCQALSKALNADLLEIKDGTDRSGGWGFFTGAVNAMFSMQTDITPEHPDCAPYGSIIVASPVWAGKLSAATRTLLATNRFDGKKVGIFSTTNALESESSREKSRAAVTASGASMVGYWQVAVREKTDGKKIEKTSEQIVKEALALVPDIRESFEKAR
jgi:flavodoxin